MPGWLTGLLKWGGTVVAIVSVIAAVYVEVVMPKPEGGWTVANMPMTLFVVFIVVGLVAAIIGWSSGSGSSGS